jgi:type VI secretion system secreted protein VgrG
MHALRPNAAKATRATLLALVLSPALGSLPDTATATVARRGMTLRTPLDDDVLIPVGFRGQEGLSQLYSYQLDLLSERADVSPEALLGQEVSLLVDQPTGGQRPVHGRVASFGVAATDPATGVIMYRAEVVPWLWFLTRTADSRIFQDMSVPEILQAVLDDSGIAAADFQLARSYPARECCVQYRETDFDFASRLMEEEGITYFFRHAPNGHVMVLADSPTAYVPLPDPVVLPYFPSASPPPEVVFEWVWRKEVRSGKVTLMDYNFQTPSTSLLVAEALARPHALSGYELYDYPGRYRTRDDGQQQARLRMEEEAARYETVAAASTCRRLSAASKFALAGHPRADQSGDWVVTRVRHQVVGQEPTVPTGPGDPPAWTNTFECIPAATPYRPPRVTPRPVIDGVQTAIVVGPSDESLEPDRYGRVKVKFHWDRLGAGNPNASCWIRVAQGHSSRQYGFAWTPRIGDEVVVSFTDGDPDRPIILGRLYNADTLPGPGPTPLPGPGR